MEKPAESYDAIILGTGYTECLLAALLAKSGKRILQIDRERFCGGANGYISCLEELEDMMKKTLDFKEKGYWNADLVPKYFVGKDKMIGILQYIGVKVETKPIRDIFITDGSQIVKVPTTVQQVNSCNLIPEANKDKFKQFIDFAKSHDYKEITAKFSKAGDLLNYFNLDTNSKMLIKHGLVTAGENIESSLVLVEEVKRFCDISHIQTSAVHIPLFGLGEITQSLLKQTELLGGRRMLNRPVTAVKKRDGLLLVTAKGISACARTVVGDPSYFPNMVRSVGKVVRTLCVLNHPTPGVGNSHSQSITLPGPEFGRRNNIYVSIAGSAHNISPKGIYVANVSTMAETETPEEELQPGIDLLGEVSAIFTTVQEYYKPLEDGKESRIFISESYDPSLSWKCVIDDVMSLYKQIMGKELKWC